MFDSRYTVLKAYVPAGTKGIITVEGVPQEGALFISPSPDILLLLSKFPTVIMEDSIRVKVEPGKWFTDLDAAKAYVQTLLVHKKQSLQRKLENFTVYQQDCLVVRSTTPP